jgi:hypothetical protein
MSNTIAGIQDTTYVDTHTSTSSTFFTSDKKKKNWIVNIVTGFSKEVGMKPRNPVFVKPLFGPDRILTSLKSAP